LQASRAPQERSLIKAFRAMSNLVETHKKAYWLIHEINKSAMVSFAESLVFFESYNKWPHNLLLKKILQWWRNGQFAPKVISHCDFIGLQYYFHSRIRLDPFVSQWGFQFNENKLGVSDMGWEIYPEGIYRVLKDLKKYNLPIIITENGLADFKDEKRKKFIKKHLYWVHKAISEGVDARGYFYWSLLDNFEWNQGFWPRFGLVEVDYSAEGGSASGGKTL
jgi:beta-glucosidase